MAGGVAGSASVVVGHPFDTIKVRHCLGKSSDVLLPGFHLFLALLKKLFWFGVRVWRLIRGSLSQ